MLSVNGYYDGHNYVTEGNVAVKPNQRVIITFLDDDYEEKADIQDAKKKFEKMKSFFGSLSHEEAEDIIDGLKIENWTK